MKKSILKFTVIALFLTLGCSKKASNVTPAACSNTIANEYSDAFNAWIADPTNNTKCKKVFDILGTLINCPGVNAVTKGEYQKLLNDSPCK